MNLYTLILLSNCICYQVLTKWYRVVFLHYYLFLYNLRTGKLEVDRLTVLSLGIFAEDPVRTHKTRGYTEDISASLSKVTKE